MSGCIHVGLEFDKAHCSVSMYAVCHHDACRWSNSTVKMLLCSQCIYGGIEDLMGKSANSVSANRENALLSVYNCEDFLEFVR